jgi:aspartate racemase
VKTLGIIGGIAPESTIEYYRTIIALHRERSGGAYPSLIINSIDLTNMIGLVSARKFRKLVDYLVDELRRLEAAGAQLAIFASNTPHIVFDDVAAASPLPLISIVDVTRDAARSAGLHRLALFGTRFTMEAPFYANVLGASGSEVFAPGDDERDLIHTRYMNELVNGRFLQSTRDELHAIIERMQRDHRIDGVILGGTELPLLLREETHNGVRLLDTGRIHADATVNAMLA